MVIVCIIHKGTLDIVVGNDKLHSSRTNFKAGKMFNNFMSDFHVLHDI